MSNVISAATCSDNYDFVIADNGHLSIENTTASSLESILRLDFNSNDDWALDSEFGIPWLRRDNTGLLQVKGSEPMMVALIQRKLLATDGVKSVEEIELKRGLNRSLYIKVVITAVTGETLVIERKV